jgi:hypothetical protein
MVVIWIMAFKVLQCLLEGYDWIKDSAFDVPSCEPDFHDLGLEAKVKGEKTGRSCRQDLVNDLTMDSVGRHAEKKHALVPPIWIVDDIFVFWGSAGKDVSKYVPRNEIRFYVAILTDEQPAAFFQAGWSPALGALEFDNKLSIHRLSLIAHATWSAMLSLCMGITH